MHPSAVLMPALVTVAEDRGLDGRRVVEAYDVGAATFRAVAELLPQHVHYARGWHTTATVGRLAAVAAVVRLVGASTGTAQHALGIVSSQAAGSRPNFGSMTKPLHAGCAARDAVMAVELAEAGFTANPDELEARDGFFDRYGDPDLAPVGDPGETLAERLEHWADAWPEDWGLKRYPACYGTHRGIDAALALRSRVDPAAVETIRVTVHPRGTGRSSSSRQSPPPRRSSASSTPSPRRSSGARCVWRTSSTRRSKTPASTRSCTGSWSRRVPSHRRVRAAQPGGTPSSRSSTGKGAASWSGST